MYFKNKFNRVRPVGPGVQVVPPIPYPGHPAYPSGHSTQMHLHGHDGGVPRSIGRGRSHGARLGRSPSIARGPGCTTGATPRRAGRWPPGVAILNERLRHVQADLKKAKDTEWVEAPSSGRVSRNSQRSSIALGVKEEHHDGDRHGHRDGNRHRHRHGDRDRDGNGTGTGTGIPWTPAGFLAESWDRDFRLNCTGKQFPSAGLGGHATKMVTHWDDHNTRKELRDLLELMRRERPASSAASSGNKGRP